MSESTPARTAEALAALSAVIRDGELSPQQRELLASLLGHLGAAVTAYEAALLGAIDQVGLRVCLWCGTRPAPHLVLGDPLCADCYRDHRGEVGS